MSSSRRPLSPGAGFTLTELLIAVAVGGISLAMAARLMVSHATSVDRSLASSESQRNFGRLSYFLTNEVGEGCSLRLGTDPATTASYPSTPCTPVSATLCSTTPVTGAGADLRVLVPVLDDTGAPTYRIIRYYRDAATNRLLRDGPRILSSGRLSTTANQAGAVVIDGLTALGATLSSDCRSVTLTLTLRPPNSNASIQRSLTLRNRVRESLS